MCCCWCTVAYYPNRSCLIHDADWYKWCGCLSDGWKRESIASLETVRTAPKWSELNPYIGRVPPTPVFRLFLPPGARRRLRENITLLLLMAQEEGGLCDWYWSSSWGFKRLPRTYFSAHIEGGRDFGRLVFLSELTCLRCQRGCYRLMYVDWRRYQRKSFCLV